MVGVDNGGGSGVVEVSGVVKEMIEGGGVLCVCVFVGMGGIEVVIGEVVGG